MRSSLPPRSTFDRRTGILQVRTGHNHAHGSLDEMEAHARAILREVRCRRVTAEVWPKPPVLMPEF